MADAEAAAAAAAECAAEEAGGAGGRAGAGAAVGAAEVDGVDTRLALARLAFSREMSALSEAIDTAPRGSADRGVLDTETETGRVRQAAGWYRIPTRTGHRKNNYIITI